MMKTTASSKNLRGHHHHHHRSLGLILPQIQQPQDLIDITTLADPSMEKEDAAPEDMDMNESYETMTALNDDDVRLVGSNNSYSGDGGEDAGDEGRYFDDEEEGVDGTYWRLYDHDDANNPNSNYVKDTSEAWKVGSSIPGGIGFGLQPVNSYYDQLDDYGEEENLYTVEGGGELDDEIVGSEEEEEVAVVEVDIVVEQDGEGELFSEEVEMQQQQQQQLGGEGGTSSSVPRAVIHPAMINSLQNKIGEVKAASGGGGAQQPVSVATRINNEINEVDETKSTESAVLESIESNEGVEVGELEQPTTQEPATAVVESPVSSLLIASPLLGEEEAVEAENNSSEAKEDEAPSKEDLSEDGEFESIPLPPIEATQSLSLGDDSGLPREEEDGTLLDEMDDEEFESIQMPPNGITPSLSVNAPVEELEVEFAENQDGEQGGGISSVEEDGVEEPMLIEGEVYNNGVSGKGDQNISENELKDEISDAATAQEAATESLPTSINLEAEGEDFAETDSEDTTEQLGHDETDDTLDEPYKDNGTEGQGAEINDENVKTTFEGFDEDFSSHHVDTTNEQPPSTSTGLDVSELANTNDYKGDGFRFHVLQPKGQGKGSSTPLVTSAVGVFVGLLLCYCCIKLRRRKGMNSKPNRGKYSALNGGGDDFFNGTFSDDISYYGKDSDDENSVNSFGSDDMNDGVNIELGGMHEMDANGGLTLEEING
ncbi:predicted protein [Thalassiosira pseudonana CCMP1335]|uniref:Uncharacterized protein n=1 Tax=Thalassiosira pseudonana TaxID=35128 RepID=B5YLL7_THAPS|nr:predicted protein [Thalassiosira pseudonana CCMP1335]ACI64101.1 predicted protein [Thalassiosira pseudonana CCMP1335]|eukprot:scaffold905_cov223-Alexandrium_tamarense.AAC.22